MEKSDFLQLCREYHSIKMLSTCETLCSQQTSYKTTSGISISLDYLILL